MSAIGAIFTRQDAGGVRARDHQVLLQSLAEVPHDDSDEWHGGPVALAAATLHTTAESREARQPVVSQDGQMAAVFAGYLLNPREVADDCKAKGHRPRNASDAEIALTAYRIWGEDCASRLEGEFAFIIADLAKGQLFAARDHMGLVPLYYRIEGERLLIASNYPTLLRLSRERLEPNRDYLTQIIANRWYLREETPWRGIKRIIRAHHLTYDGSEVKSANYWLPPTNITIRYTRDEDYAEHYREMLFDVVRRAARSDRPIAAAVSGGLDSTALFGIADRLDRSGKLLAPGLKAYSFAASEGSNAFELPYARAAARQAGRELIECNLFEPDVDWYAQDARRHADIPIPSNGAMMLGIDRQVVADGCRVIINGTGGDEWLQGTEHYYREFIAEHDLASFGRALRRDASQLGWSTAARTALRHAAAQLAPDPVREAISAQLRARRERKQLDGRAQDRQNDREPLFWLTPQRRAMLRAARAHYERLLPQDVVALIKHNLARSPFSDLSNSLMHRQRAATGLESRHPMLSRRFIEFSLQTPGHIKRRGGLGKYVHRLAMADILPSEVLERRTKANFTNTDIDAQFADYVRKHGTNQLASLCDPEGLEAILDIDFTTPEGDLWAWEIWGLYASAVFMYTKYQTNAATC